MECPGGGLIVGGVGDTLSIIIKLVLIGKNTKLVDGYPFYFLRFRYHRCYMASSQNGEDTLQD